jgi:hypothetical protein
MTAGRARTSGFLPMNSGLGSCNLFCVKSLTVRLPDAMAAQIEAESIADGISKSAVVRRRLESASARPATFFDLAGDLIGGVDDDRMPADLSSHKKSYLKSLGYGTRSHR